MLPRNPDWRVGVTIDKKLFAFHAVV